MLQKIRRHKPFHSRNSLQTKGVPAFSGPRLGWTKLRPKKSSVHPYSKDSFAFLLDVFCNLEVNTLLRSFEKNPIQFQLLSAFRYLERLEMEGTRVLKRERLMDEIGRVRNVRQGPDGLIYVAVEGKGIYRLVPEN